MSRKCPNCQSTVGFIRIVKPFITGGSERVTCDQCGVYLSKKMNEFILFRLSALPIGIVIAKLPNWFGLKMELIVEILYLLSVLFLLIFAIYLLLPLRIHRS